MTGAVHARVDVDEDTDAAIEVLEVLEVLGFIQCFFTFHQHRQLDLPSPGRLRHSHECSEIWPNQWVRYQYVDGVFEGFHLVHELNHHLRLLRCRHLEVSNPRFEQYLPNPFHLGRLEVGTPAIRPANYLNNRLDVVTDVGLVDDQGWGHEGVDPLFSTTEVLGTDFVTRMIEPFCPHTGRVLLTAHLAAPQ